MSKQLVFPLGVNAALARREDYFVGEANMLAFQMVENSESWPLGKLLLVGPAGSGKSHLAKIWADAHGAECRAARELEGSTLPDGPLLIEDAHELPHGAEETLFYIHNHARTENHRLLITARTPPDVWGIRLPDLETRMNATTQIRMEQPDEAMLAAVLLKLLSDRQLTADPQAISYLQRHMQRRFDILMPLVEELDRVSLVEGRRVTRPMAIRVLTDLQSASENM